MTYNANQGGGPVLARLFRFFRLSLTASTAAILVAGAQAQTLPEPHLGVVARTALEADRIAAVTAPPSDFTEAEAFEANPGGAGTVPRVNSLRALALPQANLSLEARGKFELGNALFDRLWVPAPSSTIASDGLGPIYNVRSCQECHARNGRGLPPEADRPRARGLVVRLARPAPDAFSLTAAYLAGLPDPNYGFQLGDRSVPGVAIEGRPEVVWSEVETVALHGGEVVQLRAPDWTVRNPGYGPLDPATGISPRVAPPMLGLGLIEAIPAADVMALADPEDADGDGISGRANIVASPEYGKSMLGRFGVRATAATLHQQAADAFHFDVGISTPLHPDPTGDCMPAQAACQQAPKGNDAAQNGYEVDAQAMAFVTHFSANLGVPEVSNPLDPARLRGKQLFYEMNCASCHQPKFVTHRLTDRPEHSFQLIWPHSDFLLHDMGPGLADDWGGEWRTPPLWGLGLTDVLPGDARYLHDGRARSVLEAVLWHGGEAQTAREAVVALTREERGDLLAFLDSL